ncbi:RNA binding RRM/RBD/RNP motifs family protein [Prunus dulcis]|uniref:RNA binding RRM/RBD/RNP motifs family protein n=1 Tax=Prunus dulcis TaxID=3755 RepID=A0A4Y1RKW3_PRUDU|nr:RNA binding RRM/RBD/RNP motifs family protein [Prunus dulcis]
MSRRAEQPNNPSKQALLSISLKKHPLLLVIMSDQGEKTCPLCAEEMDLTDQQLKPCKCGYEICVWCWHHIMDMAEKDETEGRCPACRTPYDKEKIVGTAGKCERLVAEINTEKKMKSQKAKVKSTEDGSSSAVCDFCSAEYFGQYGKVLKVSMSRTAAGIIQQFPNNNVVCKACFGTTKYCHAWLRNVGTTNYRYCKQYATAFRSVLPPPLDDYCNSSSTSAGGPIIKNGSSNTGSLLRGSPPNGSSGRSIALPAAASWKENSGVDCQNDLSDEPAAPDEAPASVNGSSPLSSPQTTKDNDRGSSMQPNISNATNHSHLSYSSCHEKENLVSTEEVVQSICSDMPLMGIDRNSMVEHSGVVRSNSSLSDNSVIKSPRNQGLQQYCAEQSREPPITAVTAVNAVCVTREQSNWISESQAQLVPNASSEVEEDVLSFDNQRLKDPEVSRSTYLPSLANAVHVSNHSRSPLLHSEAYGAVYSNVDRPFVDNKMRDNSLLSSSSISVTSNGYPENLVSRSSGSERPLEHSFLLPNEGPGKHSGRFLDDAANADFSAAVDKGEPGALKMSSPWKVQNNNQSRFSFARQEDSKNQAFDVQSSPNVIGQFSNNQSFHHGFSENRDLGLENLENLGIGNGFSSSSYEEPENHGSNHLAFSSNKLSVVSRAQISAPPGFSVPSRAPPPGFTSHERVDQEFDSLAGNHLYDTSSLLRNAYQPQATGNIGSSGDIEFMDPAILAVGKGRLQGGLNNPGLEMRSNFPSQLSAYENDARLQLLMQRSLTPQQNVRFPDFGDGFSHVNDSYGISSMLLDQSQTSSNLSPFSQLSLQQQSRNRVMSNGHWDGWNEAQGGSTLGMAELLRNDRLGSTSIILVMKIQSFGCPVLVG